MVIKLNEMKCPRTGVGPAAVQLVSEEGVVLALWGTAEGAEWLPARLVDPAGRSETLVASHIEVQKR